MTPDGTHTWKCASGSSRFAAILLIVISSSDAREQVNLGKHSTQPWRAFIDECDDEAQLSAIIVAAEGRLKSLKIKRGASGDAACDCPSQHVDTPSNALAEGSWLHVARRSLGGANALSRRTSSSQSSSSQSSANSGSHGSHSGSADCSHHQWWVHKHHYFYLENWLLICLLLIEILFEAVFQKLERFAEDPNKLVLLAGHQFHKMHAKTMWECLFARFSGELSVLGFLALTIWCCNQAGMFCKIANDLDGESGGIKLPMDGTSYLHTVEAVHIHLFLALVFYFLALAVAVTGADRFTAFVCKGNSVTIDAYKSGELRIGAEAEWLQTQDKATQFFMRLRRWYFVSLDEWRGKWPFLDSHLGHFLEHVRNQLQAKPGCDDPVPESSLVGKASLNRLVAECVKSVKSSGKDVAHDKLSMETLLCTWFPFDVYLAINYRFVFYDMIEIRPVTWCCILGISIAKVILARSVDSDADLNWAFFEFWVILGHIFLAILAALCFASAYHIQHTHPEALANSMRRHQEGRGWIHKMGPVKNLTKVLQLCLFFIMYEFSRTIADRSAWESEDGFGLPLAYSLILGICMIPYGIVTGACLTLLSSIGACGSFMQERHVLHLQTICMGRLRGVRGSKLREMVEHLEEFEELEEELEHERKHELRKVGQDVDTSLPIVLPGVPDNHSSHQASKIGD